MLHHPLQAVIPLYSRIITILLGTATPHTTRVEQAQLGRGQAADEELWM